MFVLDASVAVKWFIEESDSPKALALLESQIREKISLACPDLLIYETSNALLVSKLFSIPEINSCLRLLYNLNIEFISPTSELVISTVELASHKKITFYDALYVTLSHKLGFQFVTADKKLYESVKNLSFVTFFPDMSID